MNRGLIVAIDGPAGSGKSTVAKLVAKELDAPYIDTGAMYRAVTLDALEKKISLQDIPAVVRVTKNARIELCEDSKGRQRVVLNGKDVTKAIRLPELTKQVFYVAKEPLIRHEMVAKQRRMGAVKGAVMEGRDIGTVVFPNADYKFFLDAAVSVRAKRRYKELIQTGKKVSLNEVLSDLKKRDRSDRTRKEGPLKQAKDAHKIDTTPLTIEEVVDKILAKIGTNSCCCSQLGSGKSRNGR